MEQVELVIVLGREGGQAVAQAAYPRWRSHAEWFTQAGVGSKDKGTVFCGLQNFNLWLKCDVSHRTKIAFVVGLDSWKRCESYWTNGVLEDRPLTLLFVI
jgi:hypothetical protein